MFTIDCILFDGPTDWLVKAGVPVDENFSKYVYSIDFIDEEEFFSANNFILHLSVFTPDDWELINTFCLTIPRYVDFMILEDNWDSDKQLFFYDPYQDKTVHRFYNMARYLYPAMSTFTVLDRKYIVKENYQWIAGRRYNLATIDFQPEEKIEDDTILTIAIDALTLKAVAACTFAEAAARKDIKSKMRKEN